MLFYISVATALTVYGIETRKHARSPLPYPLKVATALTVYGIETAANSVEERNVFALLQQHLPFTVLKQCSS